MLHMSIIGLLSHMPKLTRRNSPKKIVVNFTDAEHRTIKSQAALAGKTLDVYCRDRILGNAHAQTRRRPDEVTVTRTRPPTVSVRTISAGATLSNEDVEDLLRGS